MLKISLRKEKPCKGNNEIYSGGGSRAYKNYTGMYGMQAAQLQYDEGQEGASGQNGNQQILQILQEAHGTQGNKVISRGKDGRTGCGCPWGVCRRACS